MTPNLILLFVNLCCVSGQLLLRYNFSPLADMALRVSVDEVNRQSSHFLLRPTSTIVRQITLVQDNTYDILLDFGIKETVCGKYTRRTYMDSCLFKQGRFVAKELCSSLVRVGGMSVSPLGISCVADQTDLNSSSESSSEELISQRKRLAPLDSFSPGVVLCRGELDCSRLLL